MSEQRIQETTMRHDRVSDIKLYQERRRQSGFYPNEIHHLYDEINHLLSLLDGKAPTISEAIEKVRELREFFDERTQLDKDNPPFRHYYTVARNVADQIVTALESLQSTPVGKQRCVHCDHQNGIGDVNGLCAVQVAIGVPCGCKCEFSVGKEAGEQRVSESPEECYAEFVRLAERCRKLHDRAHMSYPNPLRRFLHKTAATPPVPVAEPEEQKP